MSRFVHSLVCWTKYAFRDKEYCRYHIIYFSSAEVLLTQQTDDQQQQDTLKHIVDKVIAGVQSIINTTRLAEDISSDLLGIREAATTTSGSPRFEVRLGVDNTNLEQEHILIIIRDRPAKTDSLHLCRPFFYRLRHWVMWDEMVIQYVFLQINFFNKNIRSQKKDKVCYEKFSPIPKITPLSKQRAMPRYKIKRK